MAIKLPDKTGDLLMQVLNLFPADIYSLVKMIGNKKIVYTRDVTVASLTNDGRILLNRLFLEQNLESIYEVCTIIHHEILHKIFRHLTDAIAKRFAPYEAQLAMTGDADHIKNLVLDVQLLMIQKHILPKKYLGLFTRLNPGESEDKEGKFNPHFLLSLDAKPRKRIDKIAYRAIHSPLGISIEKTVEFILRRLNQLSGGGRIAGMPGGDSICGDFGKKPPPEQYSAEADQAAKATQEVVGPKLRKAKREAEIEKKKSGRKKAENVQAESMFPSKEAGTEKGIFDLLKEAITVLEEKKRTERLITNYAIADPKAEVLKAFKSMFVPKVMGKTRKFNLGKQERKLWVNGIIPTKFENPIKAEDFGLIQVYLDTSGSQTHVLPKITSILSKISDFIASEIIAFDTKIYPVKRSKLDKLRMGGGTSFNEVAAHILGFFRQHQNIITIEDEKLSKEKAGAVIFTDGYAELDHEWVNFFDARKIKVLVVYTENTNAESPINRIATETKELRLFK